MQKKQQYFVPKKQPEPGEITPLKELISGESFSESHEEIIKELHVLGVDELHHFEDIEKIDLDKTKLKPATKTRLWRMIELVKPIVKQPEKLNFIQPSQKQVKLNRTDFFFLNHIIVNRRG